MYPFGLVGWVLVNIKPDELYIHFFKKRVEVLKWLCYNVLVRSGK